MYTIGFRTRTFSYHSWLFLLIFCGLIIYCYEYLLTNRFEKFLYKDIYETLASSTFTYCGACCKLRTKQIRNRKTDLLTENRWVQILETLTHVACDKLYVVWDLKCDPNLAVLIIELCSSLTLVFLCALTDKALCYFYEKETAVYYYYFFFGWGQLPIFVKWTVQWKGLISILPFLWVVIIFCPISVFLWQ